MAKLINFRCPENLETDIAKIGLEFYPKENDRGYDLTAIMLAILRTGIDSITSQGLCLTEDKTERNTASITSHKTEDITELQTAIAEIHSRLESLENVSHKEQEPEKMELTQPEQLPSLDAIAVSTDDLPSDDKPQRELLKNLSHKEVATITRLKLATIRSYPSKNKPAKGRSRTFQFNKETRLWDEI
jgi:hypothetical protein